MTSYSEIAVEVGFEDDSTIKLTQGPYRTNDPRLAASKAKIIALNQEDLTEYQAYVRNENNSPIKSSGAIVGASITTVSRTTYI